MFCKNCGKEIDDKAVVCPHCGCAVHNVKDDDAPSTGFGVLGFFFPLIGLILYLVWHSDRPLRAKSVGKGALIGVIVEVALYILLIVCGVSCAACILSEEDTYERIGKLLFLK